MLNREFPISNYSTSNVGSEEENETCNSKPLNQHNGCVIYGCHKYGTVNVKTRSGNLRAKRGIGMCH